MNHFQQILMKFLYKSVSSLTHQWLKFQPIWFSSSRDAINFTRDRYKNHPVHALPRIHRIRANDLSCIVYLF